MSTDAVNRLVRKVKIGDADAFEDLYNITYKAVFASAFSILKDKMRAEDILQETYVVMYRKIDSFEQDSNFYAWLLTIAKRLAINEYHRGKKEIATDFDSLAKGAGKVEFDMTKNWLINLAKDNLTTEEFEILMLAVVCGYKRREIAAMKETPISTVSWKYKKAIEQLKELVKREYAL